MSVGAQTVNDRLQGKAAATVPAAISDQELVAALFDTVGRLVTVSEDFGQKLARISDITPAVARSATISNTQLTAPGRTTYQDISWASFIAYRITIAAVDTDVDLSIVQTDDLADTTPAISPLDFTTKVAGSTLTDHVITITVNGKYLLIARRMATHAALSFDAENGGTAVTVDSATIIGR